MASADGSEVDESTLSEVFKTLWDTYVMIEHSDESSGSDKIQVEVLKALAKAEKGIFMVNQLQLFSDNEEIEEVATNEIKYMLLPAILGYFHGMNTHASRLETIQKARNHYRDFLKMCISYKVISDHIPLDLEEEQDSTESTQAVAQTHPAGDLRVMAVQRNSKIERYKQSKMFESRLKELSLAVEKDSVDDETKREFYLTQVKRWINTALDEIESFNSEIQILQHMAKLKKEGKTSHHHHEERKPNTTFRPFILTKDALQKQIYGLGYPAIPTMSIEEFYQHKVDDGTFAVPQSGHTSSSFQGRAVNPDQAKKEDEQYEMEREKKEEEDDSELLQSRRSMDEYKDHYRRGWGNRKNMG